VANDKTSIASEERWRPGYGMVLVFLIGTLILASISSGRPAGILGALVFASSTLVAILFVSQARRATLLVVGGALAVSALLSAVALFLLGNSTTASSVTGLAIIAIAGAGPIVIGRDLYRHRSITIQTVLGAANIYLLIGFIFAVLYSIIVVLSPVAPFSGVETMRGIDLYYYSFTILTTVGMGDLIPTTDLVRVLTIIEALLGQLYLVTVIALLVGKMARVGSR
jgi:hypothetical protein